MNTRQYSDRKASKRMTRHPLYQSIRERALAAEKGQADLRKQVAEMKREAEATAERNRQARERLAFERDAALAAAQPAA